MSEDKPLQSEGILERILVSILTDESSDDAQRVADLARLTQVSRTFFFLAVELLWREMRDVLPLFKLFALLCPIAADADQGAAQTYCLRGPISAKEWDRFKLYAQYIKSAEISSRSWTIHPSVLAHISQRNDGAPLLPFLQDLVWTQHSSLDTSLEKFVSSTTRSLHFIYAGQGHPRGAQCDGTDFAMKFLFERVSARAASLEKLWIEGLDHSSSVLPFSVCESLNAVELSLKDELDPDVLGMLASLTCLTELCLWNLEMRGSVAAVQLAAVKTLRMSGDASSLTNFFTSVSLPGIETLEARMSAQETEGFRLCFMSLATSCAQSLSSLTVIQTSRPGNADEGAFNLLIKPLFRMRQLHSVDLNLEGWSFSVTDGDMRESAEAWPYISTLRLVYDVGPNKPHITSLLHFALFCSRLESIHVPSFSMDRRPLRQSYPILSHGLRTISFEPSDTPIADPRNVALFLDRIFPNLNAGDGEQQEVGGPEDSEQQEAAVPASSEQQEAAPPVDSPQQETAAPAGSEQTETAPPVDSAQQEAAAPAGSAPQETAAPTGSTQQEAAAPAGSEQTETAAPIDSAQQEAAAPAGSEPQETAPPVDSAQQDASHEMKNDWMAVLTFLSDFQLVREHQRIREGRGLLRPLRDLKGASLIQRAASGRNGSLAVN
ncbi:uncharacterized protein LAESUDRAFT_814833 [Laetiporus sulphureus 93-53]|uniref:F-box domain-containing protein n=1 Tax=Laetiporus sulphureus 93-53 TaxID=1314785 RepID=A0A165CPL0_9APHY|nr:uncharacterized protein LAESUDRAFT_814833 [Laetiporus sulphureus 93-53]KZT03187.1 hypothetical protein LAESUDRAFT_814833 [Laetiporus sulphureus 93-53]